jgi:hypothetical protein
LLGVLGTGARIPFGILELGSLDRLLLAGWVVSRFGQGLVKQASWARQQGGQPDKRSLASDEGILIYVFVLCI